MKKYTILKNWHYAFFLIQRALGWSWNKTEFHIKFKLSNECWWTPVRNDNDYDLNKLCGISFGLFAIHKNSVRLAWVPDFNNKDMMRIYGYTYDGVDHIFEYICTVNTDATYNAKIVIKDDRYIISVENNQIEMENITQDRHIQKRTYPYFGGNNRAPNTMYVWECIESFI
jgi:hypothetical protein